MSEIGQRCPGCKQRFHVFVDAWADRPGLVEDVLCPSCEAGGPSKSSRRMPVKDAVQVALFWCFLITCVSVGLVEAVSR